MRGGGCLSKPPRHSRPVCHHHTCAKPRPIIPPARGARRHGPYLVSYDERTRVPRSPIRVRRFRVTGMVVMRARGCWGSSPSRATHRSRSLGFCTSRRNETCERKTCANTAARAFCSRVAGFVPRLRLVFAQEMGWLGGVQRKGKQVSPDDGYRVHPRSQGFYSICNF
jgi:hypothetical protein